MADLANRTETYLPDEAFDVELRDIDGTLLLNDDGSVMTIGILGIDSDAAVSERNKRANRRLREGNRAKLTAEGMDADGASFLAKLTTRWNITLNGGKPECTYDAVFKLYSDPKLSFIREQVDQAAADRSNFLKR